MPYVLFISLSLISTLSFAKSPDFKTLGYAQMREMVQNGKAVVIDNREPELFRAGHIPGAINITYNRPHLNNQLTEASLAPYQGRKIIFYCSGGMRSQYAVRLARGWNKAEDVYLFTGGWPEWQDSEKNKSK